jgi:hypothetical protein
MWRMENIYPSLIQFGVLKIHFELMILLYLNNNFFAISFFKIEKLEFKIS